MLRRLLIENYGLIARAEISFADGATIFTGETGSGKTMVLGALAFALGARASADVVRRGASKASVTLGFEPDAAFAARLAEEGFELDPGEEATIVREMNDAGKSNVRVNGRASTASSVREFADRIAEIVGQHEAQRLLLASYHLELLDRFGGAESLRARGDVAHAYAAANDAARALAAVQGDERTARARFDEARFALDEIEAAAPEHHEDERLSERRRVLDNVERIVLALRGAHDALAGDDAGASGALGAACAALAGIADISGELHAMAESAAVLQSETSDLALTIARTLDATERDPGELETITARLDLLDRLKRKYGGTIAAILLHAEEARASIHGFETRDERTVQLRADLAAAEARLREAAARLTAVRTSVAKRLASAVVRELKELAFASARFDVGFQPLERIGADGAESVEFTFAANAGEPLRPLARVASGGELSRVLLGLVVVLAGARERSALVFDEIDAGIGGVTATAVGARLGRLARDAQVMCVTHLAQLASWADRHYVLEKHERAGTTTIAIREIVGSEPRATELARMLSGEAHDVALEHARTLLRAVVR